MMEISKGSIFCVCVKTDFIKGLYELKNTVKPDVLLIESTGVANPSDLKKDLKLPIFDDRFQFRGQFCIIDGQHFLDAYEVYASLEKQIASSSVFIINKADRASADTIAAIKAVIREFHPEPVFFETTYADIPLETFFDLSDEARSGATESTSDEMKARLSPEELDQYLEDLLQSADLQITPPDLLMSVAYRWTGDSREQIGMMADALPESVVRAKGFIEQGGKMQIFNFVLGDWTLESSNVPERRVQHKNVIVFIGPPESMDGIDAATGTGNWEKLGVYQPFSQP
jgi:G3E family GTPase